MNMNYREAVPLEKAYRLLNHGPTICVSAAHNGQQNIMTAAWNMPLDFSPSKVAVVLDKQTWTRQLLEASGTFAISVPTWSQVNLTQQIGSLSGVALLRDTQKDKITTLDLQTFSGTTTQAPLLEGCVAWLECKLISEPHIQHAYDLFLGEVTAAWADTRVFSQGHWHFEGHDELRTIHHVAGGHYFIAGQAIQSAAMGPSD